MSWSLVLSTFLAVFLAEMGDKTQLATMSLAAGRDARLPVFLGSAAALVLCSAIAVLAGDVVTRFIPAPWIRRAAGLVFVVMGLLFLFGKSEG